MSSDRTHLLQVAEAWGYMEAADDESIAVCLDREWIKPTGDAISETEGYTFTKAGRIELARAHGGEPSNPDKKATP